jgi:hypothetical protein
MSVYGGFTSRNIEREYNSYTDGMFKLLSMFVEKKLEKCKKRKK